MAELTLSGVKSDTLLGYLKGLGVLSILGRQNDPAIAGSWSNDGFVLRSGHDIHIGSLEAFFITRWEPAPVVSPWNGGSGFYPNDDTTGFDAIEASPDPRLARFREAISTARAVIRAAGLTAKPDPKAEKPALLKALRAALPDDALEWLDAAVVLVDGEPRYPPVLGSGGNDGRYDIANNYAQCVAQVLGLIGSGDRVATLRAALAAAPARLQPMSLAHLARDASPVNSPSGNSAALGNPWDLVLAVTGAITFAAGATRRLSVGAAAAAPFTLRATGAGYGSAVGGEKGRDEVWMPTWTRPTRLAEIRAMLREGRIQLGRRDAVTGLDAARAVGALGAARGLAAFERFAILERAGQANLSVPAGRIEVRLNPAAEALATLDPWLGRILQRRSGDLPSAQRAATRRLERAAFALASDGSAQRAAELLVAVGEIEVACTISRVERIRPLHAKAGPWLALLADGKADAETRLGVAFASLTDHADPGSGQTLRGPLVGKAHEYAPVEGWSAPRDAPIVKQLAAVHERRALDGDVRIPYGLPARLDDLERLVRGRLDDRRIAALLRGLVVLDWRAVRAEHHRLPAVCVDPVLAYLLIAFHDPRRDHELRIVPRPDWAARLRAGHVRDVIGEVHLRLRLAGLDPIAAVGDLITGATGVDGERLAAALLARPYRRELFDLICAMTTYEPQEENVGP